MRTFAFRATFTRDGVDERCELVSGGYKFSGVVMRRLMKACSGCSSVGGNGGDGKCNTKRKTKGKTKRTRTRKGQGQWARTNGRSKAGSASQS